MPARILDGKSAAEALLGELRAEIALQGDRQRPPGLAAVLVGDDPSSHVYVRNKMKACEQSGITSWRHHLPASAAFDDVGRLLDALSADASVDGILLQLPLPAALDVRALLARLDPGKDVDGLHALNVGRLASDDPDGFVPCTPAGVVELLRRNDIDVKGRRVVILGRSNLVGKPLALLLMQRGAMGNATVTVVHTQSRDIPRLIGEAEILVAAAGRPRFVPGAWLRPECVVVDVGIHRVQDQSGKSQLVGDVDFDSAVLVASAITPVPGGVGPMTVAMLMRNTVIAWRRHRRLS